MKHCIVFLAVVVGSMLMAQAPIPAQQGGQTAVQNPNLEVKVGKTRIIMRGAHRPWVYKLADGSVVVSPTAGGVKSMDGGDTWTPCGAGITAQLHGAGIVGQLADGTVLGMAQRPQPVADQPGTFVVDQWAVPENWETVTGPEPAYITGVPELATGMKDDGGKPVYGPVFYGEFICLDNGDLLAPMYVKFKEDMKYPGTFNWRGALIKSRDGGKQWSYVSSMISMDDLSTEARQALRNQDCLTEAALACLPNGNLVCAMRSGTYVGDTALGDSYHDLATTIVRDGKYHTTGPEPSKPIYVAISTDGGQSWSKPVPAGTAVGAAPRLLTLSNGVLALAYGRLTRPTQGDSIIFSTDGGETWTNETKIFAGLSSGYTGIMETEPNKILYVFDSVTAWGPKYAPDWIGAVDIEVKVK